MYPKSAASDVFSLSGTSLNGNAAASASASQALEEKEGYNDETDISVTDMLSNQVCIFIVFYERE
jgi:hypothetical protein